MDKYLPSAASLNVSDSCRLNRRSMMAGSSLAVMAALGLLPAQTALAQTPVSDTTDLSVSRVFHRIASELCANPELDFGLTTRTFDALRALTPNFEKKMGLLTVWYHDTQACAKSDTECETPRIAPELKEFMQSILRALYTGRAGSGKDAILITYEHALMYAPTKDVTEIPTYARGGYGSWAQAPSL